MPRDRGAAFFGVLRRAGARFSLLDDFFLAVGMDCSFVAKRPSTLLRRVTVSARFGKPR
jgi:hypothetical protein